MTIRDDWDAGNPQTPAGFATWGANISDAADASVRLTGAQSIAGVKTFTASPVVPNPAGAAPESAVSKDEASDLAAALVAALPTLEDGARTTIDTSTPGQLSVVLASDIPALHRPTPVPVSDTTAEVTIGTIAIGAGELPASAVVEWLLSGQLTNNTGSPANTTIRVRCNGVTYWTVALASVPTGATGRRLWVNLPGVVGDLAGLRLFGSGRWSLSEPGAGTVYADEMPTADLAAGTIPATAHNWTVTGQHSVASANLTLNLNLARMLVRK